MRIASLVAAIVLMTISGANAQSLAYYYARWDNVLQTRVNGVTQQTTISPITCTGGPQFRVIPNPWGIKVGIVGIESYSTNQTIGDNASFMIFKRDSDWAFLMPPLLLSGLTGRYVETQYPKVLEATDNIVEEIACKSGSVGVSVGATFWATPLQ